jgi:ABC-type glycerol-3-phosphate transport system substrate-binding protein
VRLMQWLQDIVYKYKAMPVGATTWTADTTLDMVKAGTLAINVEGTHRVAAVRAVKGVGNNLKAVRQVTEKANTPAPAFASGFTFTISKDARSREAAWLFVEHMISPDVQAINARVAGEMPTRRTSENDPWFKTNESADLREWMGYVKESGRAVKLSKYLALSDYIATAAQEVVSSREAPQKALNDAAKKWNEEIKGG